MNSFTTYFKMIKFEHSLFALPFAFTSMFIAAGGLPSLHFIIWVTLAMVGARSAAMGMNRLIDADIDAKNPRTKNRDLPAGRITKKSTLLFIIISLAVFFFSAFMLNPLSLMLSPVPILVFLLYSYTKRFTNFCHIVLGLALGLAPIGAWIGVTGEINSVTPFLLCLAVICWVSGFDILYSIQDVEFDRQAGLYSIPVLFGVSGALVVARLLHLLAFAIFIILKFVSGLGLIYLAGIILSGAFMVYEHTLVSKDDLSKLNLAFFNINVYISITICLFTFIDLVIK